MELTEPGVRRTHAAEDAPDTLDEIVRQYGDRVVKIAYYHVRDRYLAEDIAQEVFCRVYRNMSRFRGESAVFTWIYRITLNLCRDFAASASMKRVLPMGGAQARVSARDEARMFEEAEGGEVFAAVMSLPAKYRIAISLYYFEEMKSPEIARALGISEANVRARLSRGREMLKKALEDEPRE